MLSTLIGSLSELLTLLVQSFNLSAIFPSLVFVLFNYLFCWPLVESIPALDRLRMLDGSLKTVLLVTGVIGLAYVLGTLNYFVIRILEGYPVRQQFPFDVWQQAHLDRARNTRQSIDASTTAMYEIKTEAEKISYTDPRVAAVID